jgi:hypothetical protein
LRSAADEVNNGDQAGNALDDMQTTSLIIVQPNSLL